MTRLHKIETPSYLQQKERHAVKRVFLFGGDTQI